LQSITTSLSDGGEENDEVNSLGPGPFALLLLFLRVDFQRLSEISNALPPRDMMPFGGYFRILIFFC